jgi:hypothetical protein
LIDAFHPSGRNTWQQISGRRIAAGIDVLLSLPTGGRSTLEPANSESFYWQGALRPRSTRRRSIAAESRSHKAMRFAMETIDDAKHHHLPLTFSWLKDLPLKQRPAEKSIVAFSPSAVLKFDLSITES